MRFWKTTPVYEKEELWETYQNNGGTNLNAWTADDMTAYIVTLPKTNSNFSIGWNPIA